MYFGKHLYLLIKGVGGILKGIHPPYSQNSSYILYRVTQVELYLNLEWFKIGFRSLALKIRTRYDSTKITIFDINPNSISPYNDSYLCSWVIDLKNTAGARE